MTKNFKGKLDCLQRNFKSGVNNFLEDFLQEKQIQLKTSFALMQKYNKAINRSFQAKTFCTREEISCIQEFLLPVVNIMRLIFKEWHSTEVAFALLIQLPWVRISMQPSLFTMLRIYYYYFVRKQHIISDSATAIREA